MVKIYEILRNGVLFGYKNKYLYTLQCRGIKTTLCRVKEAGHNGYYTSLLSKTAEKADPYRQNVVAKG